jgi:hypothetical protein
MRSVRIVIAVAGFLIVSAYTASGQALSSEYKAAFGLRAGETSGITFKYNTTSSTGFEIIAGIWSNWLSLTGLYEKRAAAFNVEGMKWFYGAGGHVVFKTSTYYNEGRTYDRGDQFALGVDGIVGLEYKIPQIPFAISLEVKPLMEINADGNMFLSIDPGFGVKFTF